MLSSLALALTAVSASCAPIQGEAELWANARTRYVVVGETYGTAETPAFFGDLACAAHSSGRPIVIAVEAPEEDQGAIDHFLASDGADTARRAFLRSTMWTARDGRSSRAYFDLFERLRIYKQSGVIAEVAAIEPTIHGNQAPAHAAYEAAMAVRFRAAARRRDGALVLILTSNFHASKSPWPIGDRPLLPAAGYLPPEDSISLLVATEGEAWDCDGPSDCRTRHVEGPRPERRAVGFHVRTPFDTGVMYDGTIDLGVTATASPPVSP